MTYVRLQSSRKYLQRMQTNWSQVLASLIEQEACYMQYWWSLLHWRWSWPWNSHVSMVWKMSPSTALNGRLFFQSPILNELCFVKKLLPLSAVSSYEMRMSFAVQHVLKAWEASITKPWLQSLTNLLHPYILNNRRKSCKKWLALVSTGTHPIPNRPRFPAQELLSSWSLTAKIVTGEKLDKTEQVSEVLQYRAI